MDAAVKAKAREKQAIILISSDKHFEVFGKQLQQRFPLCDIYVGQALIDALMKHGLNEEGGLEIFRLYLLNAFGEETGLAIYDRVEQLFSEKNITERASWAVRLITKIGRIGGRK